MDLPASGTSEVRREGKEWRACGVPKKNCFNQEGDHAQDLESKSLFCAGGALALDTPRMKELYGENATAGDVLEGKVSVPGEFAPLHGALRDADGSTADQT